MSAVASIIDRTMPRVGRQVITVRTPVYTSHICKHRECAEGLTERVATWANAITLARTVAALALALSGAHAHSLTLLLSALGAYWIGDIADGYIARRTGSETRFGAAMDIMCDRISAAAFYIGFAWYDPTMIVGVGIYLAEFMVVDMYLSLAFLAWPVSSPNYFYLINRRLWTWNWSKPGKAMNSALFAVLMVATREPWLVAAIACGLLAFKITSLVWLVQLGLPVPKGCVVNAARP
ncbi:MAG: CDP-alcohol phosphatidyltransferase family protein [Gemmatimonas sp.]